MDQMFIHYGASYYDPEKFKPITNDPYFTKPQGGLWASPVNARFGWKQWCEQEQYSGCDLDQWFLFTLPGANILRITSVDQLEGLHRFINTMIGNYWVLLDFEELIRGGVDAIWLNLDEEVAGRDPNKRLYYELYGWDCDSILVMNKERISVIDDGKDSRYFN